ncbi:myb-like protein X isoform X1 [Ylistrum balloti]|uniref:myb-like protein X isoform X1 n=1 Tax=Ylistrum balloti TaxID=509963 RepID=UPI002905BB72|nr:myb-like protein X isoform X1 [Ylistrum balloti]
MSYRATEDDDDYDYSDDSFISEDEKPTRRTQSLTRNRKTTEEVYLGKKASPRKDDSRGKGRGKGRGKQRSTSQATPRVDPVIQRVLSARKLRINELRNNMEDLVKQIEDLKEENKLLKKTQYRQEKALNRFEDRESDLPQIMQRHNNETRTMREQLKKTKEKYDRTDRYLRDAEDELEKVKNKMKKYKRLVDENDLLERDELQNKVKKVEIDLEEKEVKIKDLERHVNNLSKNHRHEIGIEMARTRDTKKQMDILREENERLERQLKEKMKELEMKNIYANRMSKPGSRMMPNSYSGTPMRQQSPSSPRRRRPPSVHDLNPREKVKLYEERRKEEERKQRESTSPIPRLQFSQESKDYEKKKATRPKPSTGYHGGSLSPRKPVSTEPIPSKRDDYPSKPWRSSRQVQSEKPRGSDRQRPFLYNDKKNKADDKPSKLSWRADDSYSGNKTPSSRDYNDDFDRAPSAGSKEWERIEEDTDDSYSKPYHKQDLISSKKSPRHEKSTFTSTGKKWPWETSSENTTNVSKKPPVGSTRVYASPPSGKSRYNSVGKKSTIASTPTYTAGKTLQQQQKAQEEREARERERKFRQEQEEEAERKERWEHMERVRLEQEERERDDREERERRRRDQEERERHDREEKDRREAEEWNLKLEREKMKREAEELRREQDERQRRERERKEQERRAEEERERVQREKQMDEERRKKDLLLAKLRDIDEGKKTERDKSHDPFFLTNKADSDVASTSSSKKSYQFTKPVENLHHGKWSHEDVSIPYLEKQKKKKDKEDDVGGYQPSFGRRGEPKKTTGKKSGGDVVFNDDFGKPPKPKDTKKKDLMADLFGNQTTTKTSNSFNDDDIFSSSKFDSKKTNTAKLSLFDDEPKQTTTKRENSLSLFGGGSALLDDDTTTTKDSTKLLPRRQRHTTTTFQTRPVVNAVDNNFDDDIEEVIL